MARLLTPVASSPPTTAIAGDDPPLVVLLGPPGSGKGTQCSRLADEIGVAHVSAGDALRDAMARGSRLGEYARGFVESGRLVPDEVVIDVIAEELDRLDEPPGVLLDGFPRTVAQAVALEELRPGGVRLAIELVVPTLILMRRLALRGRTDDRPEVLRTRLASYERETRPLLAWFEARGRLQLIDGNRRHTAVTTALLDVIDGIDTAAQTAVQCC